MWLSERVTKNREDSDSDDNVGSDPLLWSCDLQGHCYGEFSFSVCKANEVTEDCSQVEAGIGSTFVGVYDGHGGPEASVHTRDNLTENIMRFANEHDTISEAIIKRAIFETEVQFQTDVERAFEGNPMIAACGSCCLVGVIWGERLYIANLGNSRAVMGSLVGSNGIVAQQLTQDHSASSEEIRAELRFAHHDDPNIVVKSQGVWRIKGMIQASKTIGDAYLKDPRFALSVEYPQFYLPEPLLGHVLSAVPATSTRILRRRDSFVIFASARFWEHITNKAAVKKMDVALK